MHILDFLKKDIVLPGATVFVIITLSGMAGAGLLTVIHAATDQVVRGGETGRLFVLFVLLLALFLCTQYYVLEQVMQAVEQGLRQIQQRLIDKIQQLNIRRAEEPFRLGYVTTLTQDAATIAQGSLRLAIALQSLVMVIWSAGYLLIISPLSFIFLIVFLVVLIPVFSLNSHQATHKLQQSHQTQMEITGRLADLLAGFKVLQLNPDASEACLQDIRDLIRTSARLKVQGNRQINADFVFSNLARYLLLLLVVFVAPAVSWEPSDQVHQVVSSILFILTPVVLLINGLPSLMRTESSIGNLYVMEAELDAAKQDGAEIQPVVPATPV